MQSISKSDSILFLLNILSGLTEINQNRFSLLLQNEENFLKEKKEPAEEED